MELVALRPSPLDDGQNLGAGERKWKVENESADSPPAGLGLIFQRVRALLLQLYSAETFCLVINQSILCMFSVCVCVRVRVRCSTLMVCLSASTSW